MARRAPTRRLTGQVETGTATDRVLRVAEDAVYAVIGLVLLGGAVALLVATVWTFVTTVDDGVIVAVTHVLDPLLLVFVLIELLGAVRETVKKRQLLAEPFILVGIIVAIKEIVLASIRAREAAGTPGFSDIMLEIGVLTALLLALAGASWLLRRKEREPEEAEPHVS